MSSIPQHTQGNKTPIQPFWNRIPAFFRYALSPAPLTLCIVLAVISAIFSFFLFHLLLYALMTKYAFEVLIHTSEGDMTPPALETKVLNENYGLVFKQLAIFILFGAMISSLAGAGMITPAMLAGISFLFLLPAMTMVLASTNSLLAAINPLLVIGMVKRTGWSYLGLYGILFIVYTAEANMQEFLLRGVGPGAVFPIYNAINLFFTVLAYHIMGYLLYQHHESLGIDQRVSNDEPADTTEAKLGMFYSYMDRGLLDAAKAELINQAKEDPADTRLLQKLCSFLMVNGSDEEKVKFARFSIPTLLKTDRSNVASRFYMDLANGNPAFTMGQAEHYLLLIRALHAMGQEKIALSLSHNLHKRFQQDPAVADIYIEAAEILSRKFNRDDMALKMLAFVLKNYPQHPRREEALQLTKLIRQVTS